MSMNARGKFSDGVRADVHACRSNLGRRPVKSARKFTSAAERPTGGCSRCSYCCRAQCEPAARGPSKLIWIGDDRLSGAIERSA